MALGGGMSCVKYLTFAANLLFAVTGLIILAVGSWLYHNVNHYLNWIDIGFFSSPVILISVGIVTFVVAFFGCCGAAKENHCMIMTFSVLLLALVGLELAVGVAGYMKHGELETLLGRRFNESLAEYNTRPDVKKTFDILQTELHCCGANGPSDWTGPLPDSCCASGLRITDGIMEQCTRQSSELHHDGCFPKLLDLLKSNILMVGAVGAGIAGIQLLGVMFACCLARSIRKEYETV